MRVAEEFVYEPDSEEDEEADDLRRGRVLFHVLYIFHQHLLLSRGNF